MTNPIISFSSGCCVGCAALLLMGINNMFVQIWLLLNAIVIFGANIASE